jgi:hypothetical protein
MPRSAALVFRRPWLALILVLAAWSCGDPSPLAPDASQPIKGTYNLTVTLSSSCAQRGSWTFRADIEQNGQSLVVTLFEGDFDLLLGERFNTFAGQTDGTAVAFAAISSGGALFSEKKAGLWQGNVRGTFANGRIDAVVNGRVFFVGSDQPTGNECVRPDHTWTFVRR